MFSFPCHQPQRHATLLTGADALEEVHAHESNNVLDLANSWCVAQCSNHGACRIGKSALASSCTEHFKSRAKALIHLTMPPLAWPLWPWPYPWPSDWQPCGGRTSPKASVSGILFHKSCSSLSLFECLLTLTCTLSVPWLGIPGVRNIDVLYNKQKTFAAYTQSGKTQNAEHMIEACIHMIIYTWLHIYIYIYIQYMYLQAYLLIYIFTHAWVIQVP